MFVSFVVDIIVIVVVETGDLFREDLKKRYDCFVNMVKLYRESTTTSITKEKETTVTITTATTGKENKTKSASDKITTNGVKQLLLDGEMKDRMVVVLLLL